MSKPFENRCYQDEVLKLFWQGRPVRTYSPHGNEIYGHIGGFVNGSTDGEVKIIINYDYPQLSFTTSPVNIILL